MVAVKTLNPKAEVAQVQAALAVNISVERDLQDVLRTNLGPKGTMKMLDLVLETSSLLKMAMCYFTKCKFSTQQSL
ncbi:T-complex protein 1 subunit zeta [Lemmus lemmus]